MDDRARIIIIDDDESVRNGLVMVLEKEGYVVDTARTGKEAIEKSNVNFYNLALIDYKLPDMNGTDLLTSMKETTPKMVKIIITGYPSQGNAIEALNKGADGFMLKPFHVEAALSKIENHLKKQKEAQKFDEEKLADFVQTRAKEWEEETILSHRKQS